MREHSRDRGRLEDILKYAQNVELIVEGITFEEFTRDIRIYYSVMKNVEVIGEAANMLTRHFRETHTELPWRLIVSMRNVLVHGYAQISDIDLWQTATTDIHPLSEQVKRYLAVKNLKVQKCVNMRLSRQRENLLRNLVTTLKLRWPQYRQAAKF